MKTMDYIKTTWRANRGFVLFLGLMFVFRSAAADWNFVPSSSMNPTLIAGDRVVVNKLAYSLRVPFTLQHITRWSNPTRGDIITFDSPRDEVNLIKRVIGVAGDKVGMIDNTLSINGRRIERTLVEEQRYIPAEAGLITAQIFSEQIDGKRIEVARLEGFNANRDFATVEVPAGHVLVMGDSRDNSVDSRFIGFVPVERVTGQATHVAMSHDMSSWYLPRAGRWWLAL
jgi:signal peptidase I